MSQTQTYCNGSYEVWNDKITTLPGLYILSVAVAKLTTAIPFAPPLTASSILCATKTLRWINLLLAAGGVYCITALLIRLHPLSVRLFYGGGRRTTGADDRITLIPALKAVECFLFPVSFFFYFLFYTDTGSTCAVVIAWYFATIKHSHFRAAVVSSLPALPALSLPPLSISGSAAVN